jgi:hypothetical protein
VFFVINIPPNTLEILPFQSYSCNKALPCLQDLGTIIKNNGKEENSNKPQGFYYHIFFLFGYVVIKADIKEKNLSEDIIIATIENEWLYRNEHKENGTWAEYDPIINGQERFWIGLKIIANQNVTIQKFVAEYFEYDFFYRGYFFPQKQTDKLASLAGQTEWISIPVELNEWQKYSKILSKETPLKLIGSDGKIIASSIIAKIF